MQQEAVFSPLTMHLGSAVKRFLSDARQVCHTLHFSKPFVHWQVCHQQIASTTHYCFFTLHLFTPTLTVYVTMQHNVLDGTFGSVQEDV